MKPLDQEYILQWIRDIAPKLAPKISFREWIKGFEDRYGFELVSRMEQEWNKFNQK